MSSEDIIGWLSFSPLFIVLACIVNMMWRYRKQLLKELNE